MICLIPSSFGLAHNLDFPIFIKAIFKRYIIIIMRLSSSGSVFAFFALFMTTTVESRIRTTRTLASEDDPCDETSYYGKGYSGKGYSGKGYSEGSHPDCGSTGEPENNAPAGFSYPAKAPSLSGTPSPSGAGGKGSSYGKGSSVDSGGKGSYGKGTSGDSSTMSPSSGKGRSSSEKDAEMTRRRRRGLIDVSTEPPSPSPVTHKKSPKHRHHKQKHIDRMSLRKPHSSDRDDKIRATTKGASSSRLERKRVVQDDDEREYQQVAVTLPPALIEHPIIQDLERVETKYYMYDDCDILLCDLLKELRQSGPPDNTDLDHIVTDARAEADITKALWNHPLRTEDPNKAALFIVPLPIAELIAYGCQWEDCHWFDEAFGALLDHPIFQRHQGNRHVFVSQHWVAFNERFTTLLPAMVPLYRKLQNVTVAMHFDPFGCSELAKDKERTHGSGFSSLFQWESKPMTRTFSIGLIGTTDLLFHAATMEKFHSSKFFLFYHTRINPLAFRSTKYRTALLSNATELETLPESSIGLDIPKVTWIDHFVSSKFCLSVRGDTPHSHALLHALRVGCIPVVVSDFYEDYAPSFKNTLSIRDWTIFIDEADFLADPIEQVRALDDLPLSYIEEKMLNVSLAQSIVLSESPYFVTAFLKEATNSIALPPPESKNIFAHQRKSNFTIGRKTYKYRYPNTLIGSIELFHEAPLVVGVFSSPDNVARRQVIRESWGKDRRVFFILSGHWDDIAEEFHTFGDILWMDTSKQNRWHPSVVRTIQSSMFFHAVENHVESYSYVALTNDYNYFEMDKVELIMHLYRPDYWGGCIDSDNDEMSFHFGYVLSRKLNHCAVNNINEGAVDDIMYHPDEAVAVLADQCGAECSDIGWNYSDSWSNPIKKVSSGRDFFFINENLLWAKQVSPYYEGIATDAEEDEVMDTK